MHLFGRPNIDWPVVLDWIRYDCISTCFYYFEISALNRDDDSAQLWNENDGIDVMLILPKILFISANNTFNANC